MTSSNTDSILFILWENFSFKTIVNIEEIPISCFFMRYFWLTNVWVKMCVWSGDILILSKVPVHVPVT